MLNLLAYILYHGIIFVTCVYTTAWHPGAGRDYSNMEINEDQTNRNRQSLFIQFVIARSSATITYIWQKLEGREMSGNAL